MTPPLYYACRRANLSSYFPLPDGEALNHPVVLSQLPSWEISQNPLTGFWHQVCHRRPEARTAYLQYVTCPTSTYLPR